MLLIDIILVVFSDDITSVFSELRMEVLILIRARSERLAVHSSMFFILVVVKDDVILFDWPLC